MIGNVYSTKQSQTPSVHYHILHIHRLHARGNSQSFPTNDSLVTILRENRWERLALTTFVQVEFEQRFMSGHSCIAATWFSHSWGGIPTASWLDAHNFRQG